MKHINDNGKFQSDRNQDLKPDRIVLSFNDPAARLALMVFANVTEDKELSRDILTALDNKAREYGITIKKTP